LTHGSIVHCILREQQHVQHFILPFLYLYLIWRMTHLWTVSSMDSNMGSFLLTKLMAHLCMVLFINDNMGRILFYFILTLLWFYLIDGSLVHSIIHVQQYGQRYILISFYLIFNLLLFYLTHGSLVHRIVYEQQHAQHFLCILFLSYFICILFKLTHDGSLVHRVSSMLNGNMESFFLIVILFHFSFCLFLYIFIYFLFCFYIKSLYSTHSSRVQSIVHEQQCALRLI
jgi:hypothetical protein